MLYECKAQRAGYRMSSDDELRYRNYMAEKRHEVQTLRNVPVSHFIIVAASFHGETEQRLRNLETEGIVVTLAPAAVLTDLYELLLEEFDKPERRLVDERNLFTSGELTSQGCRQSLLNAKTRTLKTFNSDLSRPQAEY